MQVRVLGPVEVLKDGRRIEITGSKEQALLTALATHPGQTRSADSLVEVLWGDSELPSNPANALQVRVSRLRKALGADTVETRSGGYALAVPADDVDAARFEALVERARTMSDPEGSLETLDVALSLWPSGEVSSALDDGAATRLNQLRNEAVEMRVDALLELGRHRELIPDLEVAVAEDPLSEALRGALMRALYRSGRQADALRVYQEGRGILAEELGIEPGPDLQRIEEQILLHAPELVPRARGEAPKTGGSLPARRTSFVGRTAELEELEVMLASTRIVTIVGPGGAGKTRLAIELADRLSLEPHFVDLASLSEDGAADDVVAAALGVSASSGVRLPYLTLVGMVKDRLGARPALMVLDNCEHVLDQAAHLVDELVSGLDNLRVVATSRERLGVPGEQVWRIPALRVGGSEAGPAELLFADRAAALDSSFVLDPSSHAIVQRICQRLDGLPLAIELAAARILALGVDQIDARLDNRFELLTSGARTADPRQRTLEGAIDWSYSMLEPAEAALFRALGVTRAPWTIETAQSLVGEEASEGEVTNLVTSLVERSLVQRVGSEDGRYRLLETIRAYADRRLRDSDERKTAAGRFFDHFWRMASEAEPHLRTGDQIAWLRTLRADRTNLRHAVELALEEDRVDDALRMCGALGFFWFTESYAEDECRLIDEALARGGSSVARARAVASSLLLSFLEVGLRDQFQLNLAIDMVATERESGDEERLRYACFIAGVAHYLAGDVDRGRALHAEAIERAAETGDMWVVGFSDVLHALAFPYVKGSDGDPQELLGRGIEVLREVGEWWSLSFALGGDARALRAAGDYEAALTRNDEAMALAAELGSPWAEANLMSEGGNILTLAGRFDEARERHEAARELAKNGSTSLMGFISNGLGLLARRTGDHDASLTAHEDALRRYTSLSARGGEALALDGIGYAWELKGEPDKAATAHRGALSAAVGAGDDFAVAMALEGLAGALAMLGDAGRAAVLLGSADRLRRGEPGSDRAHHRLGLVAAERIDVERAERVVIEALGRGGFDEAFERGRRLPPDDAVALASGE